MRWSWVVPVAGLAALVWLNAMIQPWTLDDAYITYRYAENFAAGQGPVYNPGERVEGYTTPLWMGLLAVGHMLGLETRGLSKVLGAGLSVGTLALLVGAHRFHPAIPRDAGRYAAGLVGSCGIFAAWAMPGMEVPLVAFLLLLTALTSLQDAHTSRAWPVAGLAGAAALASRPDCVVVVGVFALAAGMRAVAQRDVRALRAPAVTALVYGPFFLVRWAYYGWPLPNTFYAKVGASGAQVGRGADYLLDALWPLAPFLASLLVLGPFAWTAWQRFRGLGVLAAAVAAHAMYVVLVGGDVMPAFRFLAGVLPVLGLLAGVALSLLPRGVASVAVLLAVGFGAWQSSVHPDLMPRIERGVVGRNGEEVGRWLRANAPPDALLATNTAGSVAYYSGLRTIDMLGLNDAHIAHSEAPRMGRGKAGHEKADGAYVFGREPDIVHLGSARGSAVPVFRSDRELVRQPGFAERYELRREVTPSGLSFQIWVRRGLVFGPR